MFYIHPDGTFTGGSWRELQHAIDAFVRFDRDIPCYQKSTIQILCDRETEY